MTTFFSIHRERPLDIPVEEANKRANTIHKQLEKPINELSILIAEGRVMMAGADFQSGTDLAAFIANTVISEIAFLMEKGYLPKRLPKAPKDDTELVEPGGYI